jgi:hypothetical protein
MSGKGPLNSKRKGSRFRPIVDVDLNEGRHQILENLSREDKNGIIGAALSVAGSRVQSLPVITDFINTKASSLPKAPVVESGAGIGNVPKSTIADKKPASVVPISKELEAALARVVELTAKATQGRDLARFRSLMSDLRAEIAALIQPPVPVVEVTAVEARRPKTQRDVAWVGATVAGARDGSALGFRFGDTS